MFSGQIDYIDLYIGLFIQFGKKIEQPGIEAYLSLIKPIISLFCLTISLFSLFKFEKKLN